MDKYKFGEFIYNRRTALNLTQEELGRKLGVTNKAVSKWEVGETLPDVQLIPELAKALDISIDELYALEVKEKEVEDRRVSATWKFISIILICVLIALSFAAGIYKAFERNKNKVDSVITLNQANYQEYLVLTPCVRFVDEKEGKIKVYGEIIFQDERLFQSAIEINITYSLQYYYYTTSSTQSMISFVDKNVDVSITGREGVSFEVEFAPKNPISNIANVKEIVVTYQVDGIEGKINNLGA